LIRKPGQQTAKDIPIQRGKIYGAVNFFALFFCAVFAEKGGLGTVLCLFLSLLSSEKKES
jgi:hypothetical protein